MTAPTFDSGLVSQEQTEPRLREANALSGGNVRVKHVFFIQHWFLPA